MSDSAFLTRELRPGRLASDDSVVTNLLFDRLGPADVAEIERRIEASGEFEDLPWRGPDGGYRHFLLLTLGMWLGSSRSPTEPACDRPAPGRCSCDDPRAAIRRRWAVRRGHGDQRPGERRSRRRPIRHGLDFGCSSGRVVRVLATAYPNVSWHGCDPNRPAIEWANATSGDQVLRQWQRTAAADRRRRARPGLRDLDLVALRAGARPSVARGDAPDPATRGAPGDDHPRPDEHRLSHPTACVRRPRRSKSSVRCIQAGPGTRRSSARRVTRAWSTLLGNGVPEPRVGADEPVSELAGAGVRARAKPGEPGRLRARAALRPPPATASVGDR